MVERNMQYDTPTEEQNNNYLKSIVNSFNKTAHFAHIKNLGDKVGKVPLSTFMLEYKDGTERISSIVDDEFLRAVKRGTYGAYLELKLGLGEKAKQELLRLRKEIAELSRASKT